MFTRFGLNAIKMKMLAIIRMYGRNNTILVKLTALGLTIRSAYFCTLKYTNMNHLILLHFILDVARYSRTSFHTASGM